jgi:hypothetical protein
MTPDRRRRLLAAIRRLWERNAAYWQRRHAESVDATDKARRRTAAANAAAPHRFDADEFDATDYSANSPTVTAPPKPFAPPDAPKVKFSRSSIGESQMSSDESILRARAVRRYARIQVPEVPVPPPPPNPNETFEERKRREYVEAQSAERVRFARHRDEYLGADPTPESYTPADPQEANDFGSALACGQSEQEAIKYARRRAYDRQSRDAAMTPAPVYDEYGQYQPATPAEAAALARLIRQGVVSTAALLSPTEQHVYDQLRRSGQA